MGIIEILVAAGLATTGIVGAALGHREMTRAAPVPPGPAPGVEPSRPQLTHLGEAVADLTRDYPSARCEKQGWQYHFSVTGPGDGAALEWRTYERSNGSWVLVYDYEYPGGRGYGREAGLGRQQVYDKLADMKAWLVSAYEAAQQAAGSPYVPMRSSTGSRTC